MRSIKFLILFLMAVLLLAGGCERKVTEQIVKEISPSSAQYLGSEACSACHADIYTSFKNTGHPYKLNDAADAQQAGYYPYTTVTPPPGVSWSDVDKVIGGFWWKARFIGIVAYNEGYIITGDSVQYNFATDEWVGYHSGELKEYTCGQCHTTGYKDTGNQEGKSHLIGTWELNGVQCEECHGPGEMHVSDPRKIAMVIDRSAEACGKCHIRGDVNTIPASDGFIKHHEQWNEMFTTKHRSLDCVDCHEPHESLHPSNPNRDLAIKIDCEGCHFEREESFHASDLPHDSLECTDCHMPKAAKSAVAVGTYEADVHSHLWRINTNVDAEMFTSDSSFANGYLTLEYTCLKCHTSKSKSWAANNAVRAHAALESQEADGINGGQLYDKFWASETGFVSSPGDTLFTASDKKNYYRCKGCHGWDLKGNAGAYISRGPTATRPNVSSLDLFSIANSSTADELFIAIRNSGGRQPTDPGDDTHPDYSSILSNQQIWDIVTFLKETRLDVTQLYELVTTGTYPTGSFSLDSLGRSGNATNGDIIYAENCSDADCHGADGTALDLEGRSVGKFARDKGYELQHKVRYGQLGSEMGAGFPYLSITDLQDLYKTLSDTLTYPDP